MQNVITVNMEAFQNQFATEYAFCYEHWDHVAGFAEAVQAFDDFFAENRDFVRKFVKYRGDYITSDREAAAFMFALEALGVL